MTIDELVEEYEDLEQFLNLVYEEHGDNLKLNKDLVEIPVNLIGRSVKIHKNQLLKLCRGEVPDQIPSFKYIKNFGIKFMSYFEFCISIQSDDYLWFEGDHWKTEPLRFRIGTTQFEVGPFSSLMVLLTEPILRDSDYYFDFQEFASIKMAISNGKDYKDEFAKGVFYLNSYYLKPISFYAHLKNMEFDDGDPLELFGGTDPEMVFKVVKRKRNIQRKDFIKCEPLNLYNYATTAKNEQRFLTYYRILEFFMEQALIKRAKSLRYDSSISDEELIKEIGIKQEQDQIVTLLKTVLSQSKKSKLLDYCLRKQIITERRFDKICLELYKYRNSIVHAKEREIIKTYIPNPFEKNDRLKSWIFLAEEFAKECIMKLNSK